MREKNREAWEWQEQQKKDRTASIRGFVERRTKVLAEENNRTKVVVEEHRQKLENQGEFRIHDIS